MQLAWEPLAADKQRRLRYDTNAFCMLEEISGKTTMELSDRAGMTEIRAMLFCGLYWDDHELTLEKCGEILDILMQNEGLDELIKKMTKAIETATGTASKKKKRKR